MKNKNKEMPAAIEEIINDNEQAFETNDITETPESVFENIPDEIAAQIGRSVISQLTASGELDTAAAAELLLGRTTDHSNTGLAALSAKAANDLMHLKKEGKLNHEIDDYIADGEFIQLLYNMPTHAAVRIYDLQKASNDTDKINADALAKAEQSLIEKILLRKALPSSTKSSSSASPATDYSNMSSQQFRELSQRLKKAANDGIRMKI